MNQVRIFCQNLRQITEFILHGPRFPPFGQSFAVESTSSLPSVITTQSNAESFLDSLRDGFLWGVPKKRRSVEIRLRRKFNHFFMKPFKLKESIVVCLHCGHHHEAHSVCGNCYNKVKQETKEIQDRMNVTQRTDKQQEVVVLYEDDVRDAALYEGKKIVEMPKQRPSWFHPSLMTKALGRRE